MPHFQGRLPVKIIPLPKFAMFIVDTVVNKNKHKLKFDQLKIITDFLGICLHYMSFRDATLAYSVYVLIFPYRSFRNYMPHIRAFTHSSLLTALC